MRYGYTINGKFVGERESIQEARSAALGFCAPHTEPWAVTVFENIEGGRVVLSERVTVQQAPEPAIAPPFK